MKIHLRFVTSLLAAAGIAACSSDSGGSDVAACKAMANAGLRSVADDPSNRFMGKVEEVTARCRGGDRAVAFRATPWVDWSNYWATGDTGSQQEGKKAITKLGEHLYPNGRGMDGALLDLEFQRIELIKFNLFDNYTYESYIKGMGGDPGSSLRVWPEMRLDENHPAYEAVGGDGPQMCRGELIRHRTLTGICNDILNPLMGSTGTLFARNASFDATFPRLGNTELARNRHGDRLGLLTPDPQLISRELFTRKQASPDTCNDGQGLPGYSLEANCDYLKAPFFNVLAAFWIQFMTHDWFSHMEEGRNAERMMNVGCSTREAVDRGCREGDRIGSSLYADTSMPASFSHDNVDYLERAYRTTRNTNSAWWDASQIYGYDEISGRRVTMDPEDNARLLQPDGYLPLVSACLPECAVQPQWQGQESAAFPDNWNIGLSFLHNLFVREHNSFVDEFRRLQKETPDRDSGLRDPAEPDRIISYAEASDEEIYQVGRLIVSAMIAKIHTIEWTTQLLYNEPLYKGMNSNWFGLFNHEEDDVSIVLRSIFDRDKNILSRTAAKLSGRLAESDGGDKSNTWYSVLASGAGIFGLNNTRHEGHLWWKKDRWDLSNPEDVNGGVNHFGSPFNFPEEFTSVYRLHPLVPDLLEYREWEQPNKITLKVPAVRTVRAAATEEMHGKGLANWGISMGRQRLGLLHLQNHPLFLQNLDMPHLDSPSGQIDVAALDLIRDRERGVPRFNEFRRQIGLKSLDSFDDFVDQRLPEDSQWRRSQEAVVERIRAIYGTHVCDDSKVITNAQRDAGGKLLTDCLGHPNGTVVDNIEDVDMVVGWLAEYTRPHGFAISETQFHVFIINASRRLFSDRFFTSSFRPEMYSHLGYDWVLNNGPLDDCPYELRETADDALHCMEPEPSNGHDVPVSPMKRVLMRNIPELRDELMPVVNAFDPWARDRGEYYSIDWKPRPGAEDDPSFAGR
jgi:hypothetical protein